MLNDLESFPFIEPELLVAAFTPRGSHVFRNAAWTAVFGDQDAAWDRLSAEDRQRAADFIQQATTGALFTYEFFPVPLPGRSEPLPVLLNFLPVRLPQEGGSSGVQAIVVTGETLRAPDTWTQSQTYRHRMETLGRMTMGIAHDFNNLLSGILGYTELLKTLVSEEQDPAGLLEHLQTVEQAALDGAALVRKIQQYIRQEKLSHFEVVDLPDLLRGCVALTRPYWYNEPRRQGIAIDLEMDCPSVPPIMGTPTELREVFVNLILNAVQAMPDGGTITFRTTEQSDGHVRVSLIDTGTGMPDRIRKRIFEPLFTTKGERGTGMGLAVSYGILQEHDATIDVTSVLGQGTRFDLVFPPAGEGAALPPRPQVAPRRRDARILVVDDERMVRSILVRLLSLKGHTVAQAASGAEALELVDEQPFDLVFTDHGMPEMNGRQLARALRERFPELPIVLLTGDTDVGEAVDDVDVVLSKPFKVDELEATIQQLVS